jgi:hypothetical protein
VVLGWGLDGARIPRLQSMRSSTLLVLNLIAVLFHAVLQLVDEKYQLIRKKRGSRKGCFEDSRSLTKFFLFESWQALIDFMISGQLPAQTVNSSWADLWRLDYCLVKNFCPYYHL